MVDPGSDSSRPPRKRSRLLHGLLLGGVAVGIPALANALVARRTRPLTRPTWGRGHRYAWTLGEVAFQRLGDGEPIVLLHSLGPGHDSEQWRAAGELLARGYRVFALDLLGWGRSAKPHIDYDGELYTDLIGDFLEHVVGEPCHLVATGGTAPFAVQVADRRPDLLRSLALVVPAGFGHSAGPPGPRGALFHQLLQMPLVGTAMLNLYTSQTALQQHLRREVFAAADRVDAARLNHHYRSSHQPGAHTALAAWCSGALACPVEEVLDGLEVPLWLCWGRSSTLIPVEAADLWLQRAPAARLEVIEGAAAHPHAEEPNRFSALLEQFLATAA